MGEVKKVLFPFLSAKKKLVGRRAPSVELALHKPKSRREGVQETLFKRRQVGRVRQKRKQEKGENMPRFNPLPKVSPGRSPLSL